jgi:S-adenosylmethionine decarboxylase
MYGPHLIVEGYDTPKRNLQGVGHIYTMLDKFPDVIGMHKIMPPHVQKYLGPGCAEWGVSGFVIIAESHIAIHTYPEIGFFALDVFSCKDFDVDKAIRFIVGKLSPGRYEHNLLNRGEDYPRDIVESARIIGADRRKFQKVASANA